MNKPPFLLVILGFLLPNPGHAQKPKVLYLGDSQSMGEFGRTLDVKLREQGVEVYTVVAGGSGPYFWLKAYQTLPASVGFWEKTPTSERRVGYLRSVPKLEDMLAEHSPDFVVVQTGINLYATLRSRRKPKDQNIIEIRSQIEQMCQSIAKSGAKSYWILPPHSHEKRYSSDLQNELAEIMRSVIKSHQGTLFESSEVTRFVDPYPETDGIHYGPTEAAAWGEKVSTDLTTFIRSRKRQQGDVAAASQTTSQVPRIPEELVFASINSLPAAAEPQSSGTGDSEAPAKTTAVTDDPPGEQATEEGVKLFDRLKLTLRLVEKSEIKDISQMEYANALGLYEYEVIGDQLGNYPFKRVRVAHGIVFRRKFTSMAARQIGSQTALSLVPLETYKALSTWQIKDDLRPNFEMPIYTPKLD